MNIEFVRNVTLTEKRSRTCSALNKGRVYAGLVKITGSEKSPDILRSQFPQNRVQTQVICTTVVSEPLPCNDIEQQCAPQVFS